MAQVDGGYSSGSWGEPAAWGCSVYYPLVSNGGWGNGAWGADGWGLGNGGLVSASDFEYPNGTFNSLVNESALLIDDSHQAETLLDCQFNEFVNASELLNTKVTLGVSVIETVTAVESTVGVRTYYPEILETSNVTDAVSSTPIYAVTVIETANAVPTVTGTFAIQSTFSESANATDATVGIRNTFGSLEENVTSLDNVSTLAIFAVNIVETSNAADAGNTNTIFYATANVSVAAQDIVNRRLLWEPIITGTTEDWALINTN